MARIVQLVTLAEYGGAQKIVCYLARQQAEQGHEVTVMAGAGQELWHWLQDAGVQTVPLPSLHREISPWHDLKTFLYLYSYFRLHQPEVVHCHSTKAGILGRLAARLAGVPAIVFTVHGWGFASTEKPFLKKFYCWLEKLAALAGHALVFVARREEERGRQLGIRSKHNLTIPNGVPSKRRWQREKARARLGLPETALIIGTAGRLSPVKNPDYTLEIMARLVAEIPDLYFVWVGDGPLYQDVKLKLEELGLNQRCLLAGYQEDPAPWLAAMDIFVLFSRSEALPLVVIEAMQQGVPVVAHSVGGVAELVQEGRTGYLVEPGQQEQACQYLLRLLQDQELREKLGRQGAEIARSQFGVEQMAVAYLRLYKLLLQEKGREN